MSNSSTFQANVRPDIKAITLIPLTETGQGWLMSFSQDCISEAIDALTKKLSKENMNAKGRYSYFVSVCNSFYKKRDARPNFKFAHDIMDEFSIDSNAESFDNDVELKTLQKNTQPTQCKSSIPDRKENALKAHSYEMDRQPGNLSRNPYWTWLYASWKKRLMVKFPVLQEIYNMDWLFLKDLQDIRPKNTTAVTNKEHAENIIVSLEKDYDKQTQQGTHYNPWWKECTPEEQEELLIKHPWYADKVSKVDSSHTFYEQL